MIDVPFSELLGKTVLGVRQQGNEALSFVCSDATIYRMTHHQDCCEEVFIESVVGDFDDLIGNPLLVAEMVQSPEGGDECDQWTFYKLATIKGSVDIRWHGTSDGYYSVDVDFERL